MTACTVNKVLRQGVVLARKNKWERPQRAVGRKSTRRTSSRRTLLGKQKNGDARHPSRRAIEREQHAKVRAARLETF